MRRPAIGLAGLNDPLRDRRLRWLHELPRLRVVVHATEIADQGARRLSVRLDRMEELPPIEHAEGANEVVRRSLAQPATLEPHRNELRSRRLEAELTTSRTNDMRTRVHANLLS